MNTPTHLKFKLRTRVCLLAALPWLWALPCSAQASAPGSVPCVNTTQTAKQPTYTINQTLQYLTTQTGSSPYVVVSAHRGYWRNAPENSLPAFWAAANLGADAIELDVSDTSDNNPVMMHDTDIGRTTNGSGSINAMGAADFAKLYTRDRRGCVTSIKTSSFSDALNGLANSNQVYVDGSGVLRGVVLIVDVKDRRSRAAMYQTLLDAITVAKNIWPADLRPALVFKVAIAAMPQGPGGPAQFATQVQKLVKGDTWVPSMVYQKYIDHPKADGYTSNPTTSDQIAAVDPTFLAYINDSHTLHIETNEKYLNDSMSVYRYYLMAMGRAVAAYAPENFFPEGEPHGGECCQTENTNYAQGAGAEGDGTSAPQPGCTGRTCLDLTGN